MQPPRATLAGIGKVGTEHGGDAALALAHRLPEFVIDNPQMGDLGPDPFAFRVHARDAGSGLGVLDESLPVPDQNTGIKLVVEDAGACIGIASDGRVDPRTVARTRNPLEGEVLT